MLHHSLLLTPRLPKERLKKPKLARTARMESLSALAIRENDMYVVCICMLYVYVSIFLSHHNFFVFIGIGFLW